MAKPIKEIKALSGKDADRFGNKMLDKEQNNNQKGIKEKKGNSEAQDVLLSGDTKHMQGKKINIEQMPVNVDNHSFPSDKELEYKIKKQEEEIKLKVMEIWSRKYWKETDFGIECFKEARKELIEEFEHLYKINVKIPTKENRCKCCCNWIDEANNFKKEIEKLKEKKEK